MIEPADLQAPDVRALLELHLREAQQDACTAAFGIARLAEADTDVFALRGEGGALMGIAAMTTLSPEAVEVKSVRTHPDFLRKGVSTQLMDHIEATARKRGHRFVRLETHPTPAYRAAVALYQRRGYRERGPFGGHTCSEGSLFMELPL